MGGCTACDTVVLDSKSFIQIEMHNLPLKCRKSFVHQWRRWLKHGLSALGYSRLEICACYIGCQPEEVQRRLSEAVNNMLRLTSMLIFLDSFCPPKPWEEAPIYAFPISKDHLSVMCHMRMLNKDRRTESPIGNAKAFHSNKIRLFFENDPL